MTILNDIRATLDGHLASVAGLPAIAYENAKFTPTPGTAYLSTTLFLTSRRPAVRGPSPQHRYQGLYQVTVHTPQEDGTGAAFDFADAVMAAFDGSTNVAGPSVTVSLMFSETGTQVTRPPFYMLPVQIGWYIYAQ